MAELNGASPSSLCESTASARVPPSAYSITIDSTLWVGIRVGSASDRRVRTARYGRGIGAPFVCEGATILDDVLVIERREDAHLVLDRLRDTAEMHRRDSSGRDVSRRGLGRISP